MKLLIYLHSLEAGGAERVAATLANHWAARGWEVAIVTVESAAKDYYVLNPEVRRVGLGLAGNSYSLGTALRRNLRRVAALRAILREIRPDAVMAMMTEANIILALARHSLPHARAVGSERTYPGKIVPNLFWRTLRRVCYRGLDAVVALTPECADWIMRNTFALAAPVIPNPAVWPLKAQAPFVSPNMVCRPGRRILLGAGRLSQEKDFSTLIKVFGELAESHPDWDLVIAGGGPECERLRSQIRELGLSERVFLPGVVGNLGEWYGRADLYAMTSWYEGFPNTLAEALAHGLPAISFDCDTGPRDIIRHELDGLLVAPGDVTALRMALDRLMGDNVLRMRFAERSIEARERFSIERVAKVWEALLTTKLPASRQAATQDVLG